MEVIRAREKGQGERELPVAVFSGSYHRHALLWWLRGRVGRSGERGRSREREKEGVANGAAGSAHAWWERWGAAARRDKRVGRKRMSG